MSSPPPSSSNLPPSLLDPTTLLSLLTTLLILSTAYLASYQFLPLTSPLKIRLLFIWHLFDGLIHLILESSFLYNCFFVYQSVAIDSDYPHPASREGAATGNFLGYTDRSYGPAYGTNPAALLWQEYARADRRWGGADLTVVSLELLTVFIGGPLALYVCELIRRGRGGKLWFWGSVLATGELYGGFMTFAPEWLTRSPNLDTSNFMYMWVYLFFFNMLWVFFPLWGLFEAYGSICTAFAEAEQAGEGKKRL